MREVNFSIPNANKASVGITTALYDRRALDCTSTLPLINSLNNLAYLTTSSGRIRDILTVDGGIERLVCILKEGRSKDMMEMWKWNLAFQCIVNIGVRGSEQVRTRVVEADMVPVIATILDNYFQVAEKCRERAELENRRKCPFGSSRGFGRSSARAEAADQRAARARRHVPPPISIPEPSERPEDEDANSEVTPTGPTANLSLSSPPERATFPRQRHHHRSNGTPQFSTPAPASSSRQSQTSTPTPGVSFNGNSTNSMFGMRPVRDADRLPSMVSTLNAELSSQPQSPATPHSTLARPGSPSRQRRRPSIRHQLSSSGSDDDANMEESQSEDSTGGEGQSEPVVGIQTDIVMEDIVDDESLLEPQRDMNLGAPDVSSTDDDTFNITHRSAADGSTGINTPEQGQIPFPRTHQVPPPVSAVNATPPNLQQPPTWYSSRTLPLERSVPGSILAAMPRDEDVLMSLQLLAYVSKYCNLRSYFQKSHLVPRLKIGNDLRLLDPDYSPTAQPPMTEQELEDEWDNEFVQKPGEKPFNIFPLIEKFTVKPSSSRHATPPTPQQGDMQYWAGVVMRNLCRKDDSRGGIRQCAYWQCGKWEEYTRQFAKCRRCRRTKYCSKECQKGAWGNHRYWCVAADQQEGESSERHHRRHHHSHRHHHHYNATPSQAQVQQ
ncbi:hypothetical protein KC367_g3822 [Hortaea werneckii]|nr:hypothetical protein KC367_g3822 [Hortaea werneckii]